MSAPRATCPWRSYQSKYEGKDAEVFSRLAFGSDDRMDRFAQDGVSCSMCHQITQDKLGTRESLVGGFVVDTTKSKGERAEYGPYKIEDGQNRIMRTSSGGYRPTEGEHIRKSELCATCHTLITKALGPGGQVIGQLPEQMPYQEWLASEFRDKKSCQNCHMPAVEEETRIAVTLGLPRENMGRHIFVGGNFFMLQSAEHVPKRSRSDGAPRGIRSRGRPHDSAPQGRNRKGNDRSGRSRGWTAAGRPHGREPERTQVPDRLSFTPGVAARHGERPKRARRSLSLER